MSQTVAPAGVRRQAKCVHGTEPKIQTADPNVIRIMHKADFDYYCCTQCIYEGGNCFNLPERKYFWVLENAYEFNNPSSCLGCLGKSDYVVKYHFDKGAYSQTGCPWKSGCLKGDPSMFHNYSRCVCCCVDVPDGCNQCLNCYYPSMCGDRILVLTSETVCCCCPTRSCWLYNCCGLCGTKSGDPMPAYSFPMTYSLIPGTGIELANALDGARNTWKARLAGGNYGMATAVPVNGGSELK